MQAPTSDSKPRVNCPTGEHIARCVQVIDLGGQRFKPSDSPSRKIYLGFETSNQLHTFKPENGPEPFMLQVEFAWYMTSASPTKPTKLRQFMESWKGGTFKNDEEAKAFDFEKLLGRPAKILVAHKAGTNGVMRAQIVGISPAPKTGVPEPHNPLLCYEITHGEGGCFSKLPPFLQKKVRESEEFVNPGGHEAPEQSGEPDFISGDNDDPNTSTDPDWN